MESVPLNPWKLPTNGFGNGSTRSMIHPTAPVIIFGIFCKKCSSSFAGNSPTERPVDLDMTIVEKPLIPRNPFPSPSGKEGSPVSVIV